MNSSRQNTLKILLSALVFALAMAYLESAVVVYLRLLYYPQGFCFPLIRIPLQVAAIEIGREAATLVMLWFAARLTYHSFKQRFALFVYVFGLWDLFYYFWLKVLLDWPHSWLNWDILFLIPLPWIGPWLAPAAVSVGLICAGVLILFYPQRFERCVLNAKEWLLEVLAALLILTTFFLQTGPVLKGSLPQYYAWPLFWVGLLLGLAVFLKRFIYKV